MKKRLLLLRNKPNNANASVVEVSSTRSDVATQGATRVIASVEAEYSTLRRQLATAAVRVEVDGSSRRTRNPDEPENAMVCPSVLAENASVSANGNPISTPIYTLCYAPVVFGGV